MVQGPYLNLVDAKFPTRHPTKTWHRAGAEDTEAALGENEMSSTQLEKVKS